MAVHSERRDFSKPALMADWVAAQGVDKAKFMDQYNSFTTATKMTRATQLTNAYKVEGVPAMGVAGRFLTEGTTKACKSWMLWWPTSRQAADNMPWCSLRRRLCRCVRSLSASFLGCRPWRLQRRLAVYASCLFAVRAAGSLTRFTALHSVRSTLTRA